MANYDPVGPDPILLGEPGRFRRTRKPAPNAGRCFVVTWNAWKVSRGVVWATLWAVILTVTSVRPAAAVDYYWTASGTSLGGSGTWNTTSSNWFVGSSSGALGPYVSSTTSQAYLQGTSGTLTTSGTPQFCRINVTSGSFTLSGAVAWANNGTLSPARGIVVSPSAALTITSANGAGRGLGIQGGGTGTFTSANQP